MKKLIVTIFCLCMALHLQAQDKLKDSVQIEKQLAAMLASWNSHDYSTMDSYITQDCDWINIVGMWWKNAAEVKHAHQYYHNNMFKNTSMVKKKVKISFLAQDVALVHFISGIGSFETPDGKTVPAMDDIATLIFIRQNNKWLLRAGENVQIDPVAQQFDPVKTLTNNR
jgi:uncharacterized protein (TIGR02246 family)